VKRIIGDRFAVEFDDGSKLPVISSAMAPCSPSGS